MTANTCCTNRLRGAKAAAKRIKKFRPNWKPLSLKSSVKIPRSAIQQPTIWPTTCGISSATNQSGQSHPPHARRSVKWSQRDPAGIRATVVVFSFAIIAIAASLGWISCDRAARQSVLEQHVTQV